MGKKNSSVIRVCNEFKEEIWDIIKLQIAKKLDVDNKKISDPQVSLELRKRIKDAGGLKET